VPAQRRPADPEGAEIRMSPMAPLRVCATCGTPGCTPRRHVTRVRGWKLQQLRYQLFRRQPTCAHCGAVEFDLFRDHIVPLSHGGLDVAANTQALCAKCHDAKTKAESSRT
jgi:5-methylcytosine-specific restriction endonuclease McrA